MPEQIKIYLKAPLWSLFFACLIPLSSLSQVSDELPFHVGETITYELTYQWGLIWADAGTATFVVNDTLANGQRYWHFKGFGVSYPKWDWFYEVRSTYESFADANLRSQRFLRYGHEGSTVYDRDYHVKEDSIFYRITDGNEVDRFGKMIRHEEAFDVITAIYYCRTIDFSSMRVNDTIPLKFYLDGNYYDSFLRYRGKEIWKNPETKEEIECVVFTPNLIAGTIFKEGEGMTVYVTDDERRVPVYIETDLKVGKAKIHLISGL